MKIYNVFMYKGYFRVTFGSDLMCNKNNTLKVINLFVGEKFLTLNILLNTKAVTNR